MSKEMEKKTLHIVEKTYAVIYKENSEKPIEIEVDGIDPELIYKAYPSIVKLSFYNQNVAFDGRYTYKCQPFNLSRNIHFGERYSADEAKELSCSGIVNYMSMIDEACRKGLDVCVVQGENGISFEVMERDAITFDEYLKEKRNNEEEKTYAVIYKAENSKRPIEIEVDERDLELIHKAFPSAVRVFFYNKNGGKVSDFSNTIYFGNRYSADEAETIFGSCLKGTSLVDIARCKELDICVMQCDHGIFFEVMKRNSITLDEYNKYTKKVTKK